MKYIGSKLKIAQRIVDTILAKSTNTTWVEPFVGSASVIAKVPNTFVRIAADINQPLITMFKALQNGWIPPTNITETLYKEYKAHQNPDDPMTAFIGIGCSFSGKWFGGYARGDGRNYCAESSRNLIKQLPYLKGVEFICTDYRALRIPPNSIVYCDPPYNNTLEYRDSHFNSVDFWTWATHESRISHVFVSEVSAPKEWNVVKEFTKLITVDTYTSKYMQEYLFNHVETNLRSS